MAVIKPSYRIPLKELNETDLENRVYQLSCELNKFNCNKIYKRFIRTERLRILKELNRRDELIKYMNNGI